MKHLFAVWLIAPALAAQPAVFEPLDGPPGNGAAFAAGISPDGSIVAGWYSVNGQEQACIWTDGVRTDGPDEMRRASGVADGQVVGYRLQQPGPGYPIALAWSAPSDSARTVGLLPGGLSSDARSVARMAGMTVVVGLAASNTAAQAFRWTDPGDGSDPTMEQMPHLPGGSFLASEAYAVSADGLVAVGRSQGANGWEAVRWVGTSATGLGDLPGGTFYSHAYGTSADGAVIVGLSDAGTTQAFRWTQPTGMVPIGAGRPQSLAYAVSGDGQVVGGAADFGTGQTEAAVWLDGQTPQRLSQVLQSAGVSTAGWALTSVQAVSADGRWVAGMGFSPAGLQQGWRALLPSGTVASDPSAAATDLVLRIAPTPSRGAVHFVADGVPDAGARLDVVDALGRVVWQPPGPVSDARRATLPAGRLPAGLYLARLSVGDRTVTRSFVLTR